VTAAVPIVDTVSVALGTVIEQKQMAELPLIDRSYSKLIVLAPGANEVPAATAGGQFQQFFGRQPQYTVSGARPEGQVFLMDNTNVQNYWNRGSGSGQLGTTLGVEAIAEYQVLTNTYSAQFGGNGVAINAITKSGTNQWHGSLFEYYRNDRFDASNYFDKLLGRPDPTLDKNQFGGSFGGPLVRNKAFYFVTYEGLRQTTRTDAGHQRARRQRAQWNHQRCHGRRGSGDCAGAAVVPTSYTADAGAGGTGHRPHRPDERDPR
jgi:hypothetical protein